RATHGRAPERRLALRAGRARPPLVARRGRVRDRHRTTPQHNHSPRAGGQMTKRTWALVAMLAVGLAFPAAGVSSQKAGTLNMIAWEGYTQPQWVKPFEQNTGCKVHAKY